MANERSFLTRNTGTEDKPIWEKWFAITVADAVMMSDSDSESKSIVDYVDQKIADLINGAPATFDTLQEIAEYIAAHEEVATALNDAIGNKVDKVAGKGLSTNDYTNAEKSNVAAAYNNTYFTNSTPTISAIGGISAGSTFDNVPVNTVLNSLLYPYVAPTISASVTAPKNGGTYEYGTTVTATNIRAVVTKKSNNITKVEIYNGSTVIGTKTDGVSAGGTFDFTVSVSMSSQTSFSAKATDDTGRVVSANTGTFYFINPFYRGVVDADTTIDETVIKSLTKDLTAKGAKSYSYTASNQRMVIAYPASYGALSKITDPNNFDVTSTFTRSTISYTQLTGVATDYYVYVNDASTVTSFTMKFAF